MTKTLINGQAGDCLPVSDRGLLYGDGLFETILFHNGRAPLWDLHMERLGHGCRVLGIKEQDSGILAEEAKRVAGAAGHAIVRITVTRGSGGYAYRPPDRQVPVRIAQCRAPPADLEDQQREGIRLISSGFPLSASPVLAGLKHLNRLEQVLIARECRVAGVDEALVYAADGRLAEALSANVVLVMDGRLYTPLPGTGGVHGVGLAWLRREAGSLLEERNLVREDVARAEEMLVINSVCGIRPVIMLDERRLAAGPVTRHWQEKWATLFDGS